MWTPILLVMATLSVVGLAYLPYLEQSSQLTLQQTTLVLEMQQTQSALFERQQPDRAINTYSHHFHYDEATQQTTLTQFRFIGTNAQQQFRGESQYALLQGHIFNMTDHVIVQQAKDQQRIRTLTTDHLVMDWKHHLLNSPTPIIMRDQQQEIHANRLMGNYEEGWYEFTHHVQSQWQ
jgi:LPS export ABC transporter protein LptC